MTKQTAFRFPACLVPVLLLCLSATGAGQDRLLVVLHTNDMHSWFAPRQGRLAGGELVELGGAAVLGGMIRDRRAQHPDVHLYLDAGDLFQGTPISTLTQGQGSIEIMNLLAPDACAIGNHEFDYGVQAQREAFGQARFPVLQANVRQTGSGALFYPGSIRFQRNGLEIAVLGLNTDELFDMCDRSKLTGVEVLPSEDVARRWLDETRDADLRICLSHRGYRADSLLALRVPGFDLIIGGHSHTVLEQPLKIGGSWIAQAGDFGRYLGVDSLWVEPGTGLVRLKGSLVPVVVGAADPVPEIQELVAAQELRVDRELARQIAVLGGEWPLDYHGESAIGNWLAAAIRIETGSEIGLWNSGGIRKALTEGPVSLRDIWEIAPFGNEILLADLRGSQLRWIFEDEIEQGRLHMQFDGLRILAGDDGGPGAIEVAGVPLDEDRHYTVALGDYVWGQLLARPGFKGEATQARHTGRIDRDLLIERAVAEQVITPLLDGRWGVTSTTGESYR